MSIVKKSLDDLKKEPRQKTAVQDETIDYSDIPELDESFWEKAQVNLPETKTGVYIRLDTDVLQWLKSAGRGYQTRINAILRAYYEAHQK